LYRDPLGYLTRVARKYGDIIHVGLTGRRDFLLNHPDYIRTVLLDQDGLRRSVHRPLQRLLGQSLLTTRGRIHRQQRALLQPVFQKQRIAALGEVMVQQTARWSEKWRDGATVDMEDEMTRLSMSITGKTLFDVDVESEASEVADALIKVLSATRFNNLLLASKKLAKLPLPANRRSQHAAKRLDQFIYQMIAERHAESSDRPDLLSVLVRTSKEKPRLMNDQKIRNQILTFFVAGHETVATALMWTWYLLAKDPGVTEKLHTEIDAVLGGKLPAVADLEGLPYAKMVFAEPERFDPERWRPEAIAARPRFSYFPFGGGGLQCIGEGFAWTQAMLVIGTLASRWQMRLAPGPPIELEPQLTLGSKYGMPMKLERRHRPTS